MSDGPAYTSGPTYRPRPEEFRELRPDLIPLPRRNYQPGPAPIPLDSRLKSQQTQVTPVTPPDPKPAPSVPHWQRTDSYARGQARARLARGAVRRGCLPWRILDLLSQADQWMTAYEIYRALTVTDGIAPASVGLIPGALTPHVECGRVLARPLAAMRPGATTKNSVDRVREYRLATLATPPQESPR